jgi:hypothetical protein
MSFLFGTQVELLYSIQAPVTKNTFTTEAAISGVAGTNPICLLPAGYFGNAGINPLGRSLLLKAMGTIQNTAAATFAAALGLDTTPGTKANGIAVMAATAPVASVTAPWSLEAIYTCTAFTTSAMSLQVNGTWRQEAVASGGAGSAAALTTAFSALLTGIDPRVALYPELFGTWSASSASNSTVLQQMLLFGLN